MKGLKILFFIVFLCACEKADSVEKPETEERNNEIVAWYPLNAGSAEDKSVNGNEGKGHHVTAVPNRHGVADMASYFNGTNSYIEMPDQDYLSISQTKELTISVWMKLEVRDFPSTEREDYVHWLGKGITNQHEYTFRIYDLSSYRPNRISGYAFNPSGGLGAGMFFEEKLPVNQWMHIVVVYDYPNDSIKIYRDGRFKGASTFSSYTIIPRNGSAPLRIGTRDFASFFKGSLDDLKIYNRVLTDEEMHVLFNE